MIDPARLSINGYIVAMWSMVPLRDYRSHDNMHAPSIHDNDGDNYGQVL